MAQGRPLGLPLVLVLLAISASVCAPAAFRATNQNAINPSRSWRLELDANRLVHFNDEPGAESRLPEQLSSGFSEEQAQKEVQIDLKQANRTNNQEEKQQQQQVAANQSQGLETNELGNDFLSLFDELWRLKNSSVVTLVRLEYFQNKTAELEDANQISSNNDDLSSTRPQPGTGNSCTSPECATAWPMEQPKGWPAKVTTLTGDKLGRPTVVLQIEQQFQLKKSSPTNLSQAATRLSGWLSQAQLRLQELLDLICAPFKGNPKLGAASGRRQQQLLAQQRRQQLLLQQQQQQQQQQQLDGPNKRISGRNVTKILEELAAGSSVEQGTSESVISKVHSIPGRRAKRQVSEQQQQRSAPTANLGQSRPNNVEPQQECVNLTIDELSSCKSIETQTSSVMGKSFPANMAAIEANCKHSAFLLANCWPQQLSQLKLSLGLRNETLVSATEFPLKPEYGNQGEQGAQVVGTEPPSCGSGEPQEMQVYRDRISWMWLNLCMDKKFRTDYVQNIRCLISWNQERAQQVCSNEYKQMHGYLAHQTQTDAAAALAAASSNSTSTVTKLVPAWQATGLTIPQMNMDPNGASNGGATAGQGLNSLESREIGSKMLCCMFDQFLRCVHRHASRDCGRVGAQFVVNFMSRIGMDDMRFLCNSESRIPVSNNNTSREQDPSHTQQQQKQQHYIAAGFRSINLSSNRTRISSNPRHRYHNNHNDRSLFIDGNYCTDPRIQSALQNISMQFGDPTRPRPSSQTNNNSGPNGPKTTIHHLRNKGRNPLTHDPAYFDGFQYDASSSAHGSTRGAIISTWLVVFFFLIISALDRTI